MGNETHQSSLWSGGLIAASFIFLQGFLSKSSLDFTNLISIFAFAFAIPILTCNILVNFARRKTNEKASIREILFYSAGIIASLIGIAAAFYSMCHTSAVVFLIITIIAVIVYFKLTPSQRA